MLRFATALVSILLMGFQAAPPALPGRLASLMDDAEAARSFNYFWLKGERMDLTVLNDAAKQLVTERTGAAENDLGGRCMSEAELEVRMGLEAANLASDSAAFEADKAAASTALNAWDVFSDGVVAGDRPATQPLASIASWVRGASNAPTARELSLVSGNFFDGSARIRRFAMPSGQGTLSGANSAPARWPACTAFWAGAYAISMETTPLG